MPLKYCKALNYDRIKKFIATVIAVFCICFAVSIYVLSAVITPTTTNILLFGSIPLLLTAGSIIFVEKTHWFYEYNIEKIKADKESFWKD